MQTTPCGVFAVLTACITAVETTYSSQPALSACPIIGAYSACAPFFDKERLSEPQRDRFAHQLGAFANERPFSRRALGF